MSRDLVNHGLIQWQFIPYGATLTNLFVKDKNGEDVDVVLGYDDVEYYRKHPTPPRLCRKA